MNNSDSYKKYFKNHYGYSFSSSDLKNYYNWFYSQWRFINSKVFLNKDLSVLELGSSIGGFAQFLKKSGFRKVIGIELDQEAVNFSNNYFSDYSFFRIPIESFPKTNNYNYIFSFEVLEHLENPIKIVNKMYHLLKINGFFIGTSPYPFCKNTYADKTHKYVLHPSNWIKIFQEAGFRDVKTYPLTFFPLLWRLSRFLNIRIPFYLPFDGFISTTLIVAKK